ncbi:MAG: SEL1-like repeat protein [Caulobacteraceae bacterium]|nr:SEL1-like repeat protein [Caulobacteraceae bacterium]
MSAGAPWSVKGIDPKAREIAKDLARRSGMTLGEWLNRMIVEGGEEDDTVTPLGRRPVDYRGPDRRERSRRLDDAYHDDEPDDLTRVTRALEELTARIETAERRSTLAVSGIDQAVAGLLGKLEAGEREQTTLARRLDDFYEDRREDLDRLRRLEREVSGPKSVEALRALEGALGKVANQIYETEARTRQQLSEVQGGLAAAERRIDKAEARPDPTLVIDSVVARVAERLERAEQGTSSAIRTLETSFAQLDERMRGTEARLDTDRLDKLAHDLGQKVADARIELIQRFDHVSGGRFDKVERALDEIARHVQASETRSAQAIEKLGHEVLRIAGNLNNRMTGVEKASEGVAQKVGADMARFAEAMETRLRNADATHAQVLERLGGEIARISEKLGERIIQSERRAALTAEDVGERVGRMADKMEARYERASSELSERIRLSEERTVRLLDEARATLDRIAGGRTDAPDPVPAPAPAPEPILRRPPQPEPEPAFPGAGGFGTAAFDNPAFDGGGFDPAFETPTSAEYGYPPATTEYDPSAYAAPGFDVPAFDSPAYEQQPFAPTPAYEPQAQAFAAPFADEPGSAAAVFDDFAGETEFVNPATYAAGAPRPAVSTKEAIDAARAAARLGARGQGGEPKASGGFPLSGLKLGSKQRLQQRLDKEKKRETSTVKKALLASAVAATVTTMAAGYWVFLAEPEGGYHRDGAEPAAGEPQEAVPLAAVAVTPTDGALPGGQAAESAYRDAVRKLDANAPDAVDALLEAANQGSPGAQYDLARIYREGGHGVEANPGQARKWVERSALAGNPAAMHDLGLYYWEGIGGPKNPAGAVQWFTKAAEAGLVNSQYNLARIYELGQGVPRNLTEAYKWYSIAAATGDEGAKAGAASLRDDLTAAQRTAAERAAVRFQAAQAVAAQTSAPAPAPAGE